ncbi:MAG: peptidoglycan DD-metalloendopeptidase family protein [Hyphomicrobiales bacterium]|nr:peptidoglycan DD-metalloendopeptidase family protein [Hyphomicrobiales bacterium]
MLIAMGTFVFARFSCAQESLTERHYKSTQILEEIKKEISASSKQELTLADEISTLNNDRAALNEKLIAATTNSRRLEQKIQRISTRILELEENHKHLHASLNTRKSLLSEVLAALQMMGKNPPPALLVTPQDALISVRSAILLGSVVPEIRSETKILSDELSQLRQLSLEISNQRTQLKDDLKSEASEEQRVSALIKEKKKRSRRARVRLADQGIEAAKLAARATNLTNLINKLETEIKAVRQATEAAKKADSELKLQQKKRIADARQEVSRPNFSDTSRISPAVKFADAKGHLIKPVNGVEIRKFGAIDELGEPSPSVAIATRINARVISPADGWVVYSGSFRSYGQLLILNVGSDYHIVLSGMEKVEVGLGQFVLVGEPVGLMGSRRIASASTIDVELTRPVLAIEFRRKGEPINPAHWWQVNTEKRANNDS